MSDCPAVNKPEDGSEVSRRSFLFKTASAVSGATLAAVAGTVVAKAAETPAPPAAPPAVPAAANPADYVPGRHHYVYLIDINKCIGCGSCVRACERENNVPQHFFRTWIERYMVSRTGEETIDSPNGGHDSFEPTVTGNDVSKAFFVPKICNHCANSPCIQLCPVGASFRSPDGVVLVDQDRCIGCGYCVQACPYGSRFIHPEKHVASKCTLCYHRISRGMKPACVEACPTGTRRFGESSNPDDEVSAIVATQAVQVLKPELNTEPNCYYMGLSKEVR